MRTFFHLSSFIFYISSFSFLLVACQSVPQPPTVTLAVPSSTSTNTPILSTPTSTPTLTFTPQPISTAYAFGPNAEDFPADVNSLTGLAVEEPSLLNIPALLISISHFPATARPQAGLSFAPIVYEFSITEGATRHLAVFYGKYPEPEIPLTGVCDVRREPISKSATLIGNRVWLDANENGRQDAWEAGVGGVCVNLRDPATDALLDQSTTDSNGYYAFNVGLGAYIVEFVKPTEWIFTRANVGDDNGDSDADPATGRARIEVTAEADDSRVDAGLVAPSRAVAAVQTSTPMPLAQVGPVRSGRLVYADIAAYFTNSCLIFAFASEEVLDKLPPCAFVTHEVQGGGFMLDLDRMIAIAEDHARKKADTHFNYASNVFSETAPTGGTPATRLNEYWASLNQSGWVYDAASQTYWRSVDDSTEANQGIQHFEVDRLNNRQLQFENVIVIMAEVDVISPTNLDIHLEQGESNPAFLFRDGMKYDIKWSAKSTEYEKRTGQRRPMQFLNLDGSPAALKPGRTWVVIITPWSLIEEKSPGVWLVRYSRPAGEK